MSVVVEVEGCSSERQVEIEWSQSGVVLERLEGGGLFLEVDEWECEICLVE